MRVSKRIAVATLGLLLSLAGVVGSFVIFLQPWRSSPAIDDGSAGCPAAPNDLALLGLALFILLVGIVFLIASMRRARIPSDAAGPYRSLNRFK